MDGRKPVITEYQRELIVKQANVIGEDGVAMIQDIEDAALVTGQMAADVFKLIESCLASLNQKVGRQMRSDEVTRQKEPERLKQIEAIREQATMLLGSRLNGDKPCEESIVKTMRKSVNEYMAAVDQDREDGLDPTRLGCGRRKCKGSWPMLTSTCRRLALEGAGRTRSQERKPRTVWLPSSMPSTRRGILCLQ